VCVCVCVLPQYLYDSLNACLLLSGFCGSHSRISQTFSDTLSTARVTWHNWSSCNGAWIHASESLYLNYVIPVLRYYLFLTYHFVQPDIPEIFILKTIQTQATQYLIYSLAPLYCEHYYNVGMLDTEDIKYLLIFHRTYHEPFAIHEN